MQQLAPLGILFLCNRHHIVGRALALLQAALAGKRSYITSLVLLDQCPTDEDVTSHKIFITGGALHCIVVGLMTRIKPILEKLSPVWGLDRHRKALSHEVAGELKVLFVNEGHAQTGADSLGPDFGSDANDWQELAHCLVEAKRNSDIDYLRQRQAGGLSPTTESAWPDAVGLDGEEDPFLVILDDQEPLPEITAAVQQGHSFAVASDGSKETDGGAGFAVVVAVVRGDVSEWKNQDERSLEPTVIVELSCPVPRSMGCTLTQSYETEMLGLLAILRVMGPVALGRTLAILDALSVLQGIKRLFSTDAQRVFALTSSEIRSLRGSVLVQRLVRVLRRSHLDFGAAGWGTGGVDAVNSMRSEVSDWPRCNSEGQMVAMPQEFHIGRAVFLWIRSHQPASTAGPVTAAVALNVMADKSAEKAAKKPLISPNYQTGGESVGAVLVPASPSKFRCLFRGSALDDNVGDNLRALCEGQILRALEDPSATGEADARVFQKQWGPLKSPQKFRDAVVRSSVVDLREKMYASWWGHYGRLERPFGQSGVQAPWERECPLCRARWADGDYSTSHALVWCTQARLRSLRTNMLAAVDRILGAASIRLKTVRVVVRRVIVPSTVMTEDHPAMINLERAGDYLLDGDVDAMRGVTGTDLAEWVCSNGTVVEEGKEVKVPRDKVVRVFRDVAALLVVDGRNLLDVYRRAVEDCDEVREYMEGLENPL